MTSDVLHIVFTASGAATLRPALRETGRDDRVIALMDSLSFGPINPPNRETRAKWIEDELGYTGWNEVGAESDLFWTEAIGTSSRKIAWLSRRSAQEYAGFLELVWRLGNEPLELIDLTDVVVAGRSKNGEPTKPHLAISLAMLFPDQIIESNLPGSASEMSPVLRHQYRDLWRRLRDENAPLRVLREGALASAPISFFDPIVMSHVTPEWRKAAFVIGKSLVDIWDTEFHQTDDLVLASRLRALVNSGRLESRGDLLHIRNNEVRLRSDLVHGLK